MLQKSRSTDNGIQIRRMFERGFLSADCGSSGFDDIGYYAIYKPDIDGSSDALCDYVFNETVIVYSHDDIRHIRYSLNDMMNIWSILWLSNLHAYSKVRFYLFYFFEQFFSNFIHYSCFFN